MTLRETDKKVATFSMKYSAGRGLPFQLSSKTGLEISKEQAQYFQKMIFIDVNTNKLHFDAKKACERVGVNP